MLPVAKAIPSLSAPCYQTSKSLVQERQQKTDENGRNAPIWLSFRAQSNPIVEVVQLLIVKGIDISPTDKNFLMLLLFL